MYEVPAYESPRFNDGELVSIYSDETRLWRFETLPEPDGRGRARLGHISGQVDLVQRPSGDRPSRGWAAHGGSEYVRNTRDQTPAGNQAMVEAGMRVPSPGVPYVETLNRYNGGHVLAASLGGPGEGIHVTAQAESNNQDRFHRFQV